MEELLTPQELAEYLKLNPTTVIRKAHKGEIPAIRIGRQFRFNKEEIERWLLHRTVGKQAQILVVDDEPLIGQLFRDSLNNNSYQVTTTASSPDALELVARERFDLIFIDLVMPEINGSELLGRIRKIDKQVPVAIITGYPDSELLKKSKRHGPLFIMIKPFTAEDIQQAVRSFVQNHSP